MLGDLGIVLPDVLENQRTAHVRQGVQGQAHAPCGKGHGATALAFQLTVTGVADLLPLAQGHV
ncbi:hypothetical protein D9M69_615730 [compost metagenome]